jgi:hypothetical protein
MKVKIVPGKKLRIVSITRMKKHELSEGGARYWATWITLGTALIGAGSAVFAVATFYEDKNVHSLDQIARAQNLNFENENLKLQGKQLRAKLEEEDLKTQLAILTILTDSASTLAHNPQGAGADQVWDSLGKTYTGRYLALGPPDSDLQDAFDALGRCIHGIAGGLSNANPDQQKDVRRLCGLFNKAAGNARAKMINHISG